MHQQSFRFRAGFTITEILMAIFLLGVIAIFIVPKLVQPDEDRMTTALIQKSFVTIGELYLARKNDPNYAPENINRNYDGAASDEYQTFARYLYDHLNYIAADDPATVLDYCVNSGDAYFVLPGGVRIIQICDTLPGHPNRLDVSFLVPTRNGTAWVNYWLTIPEEGITGKSQNRYTTLYGHTQIAADCGPADPILNIAEACP